MEEDYITFIDFSDLSDEEKYGELIKLSNKVDKLNNIINELEKNIKDKLKDNVYDNGCYVLGEIINVKEYVCKNADSPEEVAEIIDELENYDADDIVVIHYDNPMGYTIERFTKEDIMEV